jgi:probable HAF family extracellular repeat protein
MARMRMLAALVLVAGLSGCPPKPPPSTDPHYSIILLDARAGVANAINNHGEVVGYVELASGQKRATLWRPDGSPKVVDLGLIAGTTGESEAYAINDFSQVAGWSNYSASYWHAFLWTAAGGMQDLGTLGGPRSTALDINGKGQVAGRADVTVSGPAHAFIWDADEKMRAVPGSEPGSAAFGVSATGTVVGSIGTAFESPTAPPPQARRWSAGASAAIANDLGGQGSMARAVNVLGTIVGKAQLASGDWVPFRWSPPGPMTALPMLGGCQVTQIRYCGSAEAINATPGDIVGTAANSQNQLSAVLWRGGLIYDLNGRYAPTSGWIRLVRATGINLDGRIVGEGLRSGPAGPYTAPFLLVPTN